MIPLIGGFESTYLPRHDRDVMETTGHDLHWQDDLALLRACGVERLRYPVRWHRVQPGPGEWDWTHTDAVLGHLHDEGFDVILDLVHHTSHPAWLRRGFADRRFAGAYLTYVERALTRYPWIGAYTVFNEPFSTLFLAGHEAIWPPYHSGIDGFIGLCRNVLPAVGEASRLAADLLPEAKHVWVDSCEHHDGGDAAGRRHAEYANDRRFFVLDAVLGSVGDVADRPFVQHALEAGAASLCTMPPGCVDVLGLDYYAHCQWRFEDGAGRAPSPTPRPPRVLFEEYATRYARPVMVTETNLRGAPSDRATWFRFMLEQCEAAVLAGVDLRGLCWFPFIDSADWDSLLYRCEGNIDPVGVMSLGDDLERMPSTMTESFLLAAGGAPAAALPAYRLQRPVADWLAGYATETAHWHAAEPPARDRVADPHVYDFELRITDVS